MTEEQRNMITRLQQLGLTMDDLREYLDTHPDDTFAIERFDLSAAESETILASYKQKYGPLRGACGGADHSGGWSWAMGPFPWNE